MEIGLNTELECRNCGSAYDFVELPVHQESRETEYCERCGHILMQWQGERCCVMNLVPRQTATV